MHTKKYDDSSSQPILPAFLHKERAERCNQVSLLVTGLIWLIAAGFSVYFMTANPIGSHTFQLGMILLPSVTFVCASIAAVIFIYNKKREGKPAREYCLSFGVNFDEAETKKVGLEDLSLKDFKAHFAKLSRAEINAIIEKLNKNYPKVEPKLMEKFLKVPKAFLEYPKLAELKEGLRVELIKSQSVELFRALMKTFNVKSSQFNKACENAYVYHDKDCASLLLDNSQFLVHMVSISLNSTLQDSDKQLFDVELYQMMEKLDAAKMQTALRTLFDHAYCQRFKVFITADMSNFVKMIVNHPQFGTEPNMMQKVRDMVSKKAPKETEEFFQKLELELEKLDPAKAQSVITDSEILDADFKQKLLAATPYQIVLKKITQPAFDRGNFELFLQQSPEKIKRIEAALPQSVQERNILSCLPNKPIRDDLQKYYTRYVLERGRIVIISLYLNKHRNEINKLYHLLENMSDADKQQFFNGIPNNLSVNETLISDLILETPRHGINNLKFHSCFLNQPVFYSKMIGLAWDKMIQSFTSVNDSIFDQLKDKNFFLYLQNLMRPSHMSAHLISLCNQEINKFQKVYTFQAVLKVWQARTTPPVQAKKSSE